LTVEDLNGTAASKFEEAADLSPGPKRQEISKKACSYKSLADMKARLSGDLRSPA
jgi:hypothetical protein